jgi:HK97 family phage major capsid protein
MRKGIKGLDTAEMKALQEGTDSEGGYAVPTDDVRLPAYITPQVPGGSIRMISSNFTTTRDAGDWPTIGSVSWAAVAEEAALPSTTDPTFGQITFSIKKVMGHHKVSTELLEDSAVNLPAVIGDIYGSSLGRYEDQQAIEGDGSSEPQGIRTSGGVDASGAALVDASDGWDAGNIINQFFQLGAQYRNGAAWHTTSTTLGRIYGIGAAAAGIHFLPDVATGAPTLTLMGAPVYTFDGTGWDTTLSGTNEYGCFGNFRLGYYFINRVGMTIRRLDELYAGNDQVGFVARVRYDSRVADNSAFLIMKGEA